MFFRKIQQRRGLQILHMLPQRLSAQTAVHRRTYATYEKSAEAALAALQLKPIIPYTSAVRFASLQHRVQGKMETPLKRGLQSAMDKLDIHYQKNGFIGMEQLQYVLDFIKENPTQALTNEQSLYLLNLTGCVMPSLKPEERISNFLKIWQYLQQHDQLTKDHYHTMLQVLEYNRSPLDDYKAILQEYEKHNGTPMEILSPLLAVAAANGNVKQATDILAEMRAAQLVLTEHDFNSLLLAHARAKDINGLITVKETMHATGLQISTETQSTLVAAYMENGDENKASNILQQYHEQFQNHDVIKMLQSIPLCTKISQEFVCKLVKQFKPDYIKGAEVPISLRIICIELLYKNLLDYALTIIDTLPKPNFQENQDVDTYGNFFIHALFKANSPIEKIIDFAIKLEETDKNSRALHVATEMALKINPPIALKLFDALVKREQPLRPQYFWPLMMYNFRRHNEAGIVRTLRIMQNFKIECDQQTIVEYVIPKLSIIVANPQVGLQQLEDTGIKTSSMLTPIVSHLLQQSKWYEVDQLIEPYTTKINAIELISPLCGAAVNMRASKRYFQFAKLLGTLSNKNVDRKKDFIGQFLIELISTQQRIVSDHYSLQRLLVEMQKIDLCISPAAAAVIPTMLNKKSEISSESLEAINQKLKQMTKSHLYLANSGEDGSGLVSSFIKHPRDMTYEELEYHLVELESKQMNARGVLRRLLQVCVRDNKLERALEIKNKCDKLNVQTSAGMLASIFDLYTKLEDLENAKKCLETLQRTHPGFNIDEHKFVNYAALLVKRGQLENAKKILEERSLKQRIMGGDYLLKNVWNLLTNVAQLAAITKDLPDERNLTREIYAFLQKFGYCKTHNAILGPIVRERLLRGDLSGAVAEFKQLAQKYQHTPLQFELLSLIVRLCNGDEELAKKYNCSGEDAQKFLAEMTEIVTKIHGEINMNSALLLAFAESGSDSQLRRLLITPEFRINEELLLRNCEHLGKEGAVQTLLRLARGTRGLNRVIDEQNIYNMLLNQFVKANNCEAAINLYENLEAEDELKVSQDFLRNLVALLKANNVEIPSNIALRARVI